MTKPEPGRRQFPRDMPALQSLDQRTQPISWIVGPQLVSTNDDRPATLNWAGQLEPPVGRSSLIRCCDGVGQRLGNRVSPSVRTRAKEQEAGVRAGFRGRRFHRTQGVRDQGRLPSRRVSEEAGSTSTVAATLRLGVLMFRRWVRRPLLLVCIAVVGATVQVPFVATPGLLHG